MSDTMMQDDESIPSFIQTLEGMTFIELKNLLAVLLAEVDKLRGDEIPDIDRMAVLSTKANAVINAMEGYLNKIGALVQEQQVVPEGS